MLRAKVLKLAHNLGIFDHDGLMGKTKIAGSLRSFRDDLNDILDDTEHPQDVTKALGQLLHAQAKIKSLVRDITDEQMRLISQGEVSEQNLLLGILLVRQDLPMEQQLQTLERPEFKDLKVAQAVVAARDMETPLFKQVAAYLDGHGKSESSQEASEGRGSDGRSAEDIVKKLEERIRSLTVASKVFQHLHAVEMKTLEASAKAKEGRHPEEARKIRKLAKGSQKDFVRQLKEKQVDIDNVMASVAAIKHGDLVALHNAEDTLQNTLAAVKESNGFFSFIEEAHLAFGTDCPYCAAQCVDRCHTAGRSYVACLAECADAGK